MIICFTNINFFLILAEIIFDHFGVLKVRTKKLEEGGKSTEKERF